ncbi:DUF1579 domain-containing protein [Ferruginibacter albus]|uniref:DUF1579 domain-containing protein n=1 Tax=Ferruginibacter albus TaxID=2875540 RepID=UPI001CC3F3B0|nr:DUF1579 domain-containing protein [Ferruginibacter albus]UAY50973.1 DUF1579 domain-containing protein [Ferruginibacter albus]
MKKTMTLVALFIAFCNISSFAQTDAQMKAWQDYMTPSDVHKMIAKCDGTWNEDVTMWMKPGDAPIKNKATAVNQMILGGRYQQTKTTGDMMGMPFEGFSLLGYDNLTKEFTSTWLDNFGTGTMTLKGKWDDKTKSITFKGKMVDPMSGKEVDVKEVLTIVDDNHQKFEMYIVMPTGEFKSMEISSTRA